jgi:hypothetical protein
VRARGFEEGGTGCTVLWAVLGVESEETSAGRGGGSGGVSLLALSLLLCFLLELTLGSALYERDLNARSNRLNVCCVVVAKNKGAERNERERDVEAVAGQK